MRRVAFWSVVLVLAAVVPAGAEEGKIPIFEPTVITESGKYIVTRAITHSAKIVDIVGTGVEKVEIDLNGFDLTLTTGMQSVIEATGLKRLVVRNGSLTTTGRGIRAYGVIGGGGELSTEVTLEDLEVRNGTEGLRLDDVSTFAVRRCILTNQSREGIFVVGAGSSEPVQAGLIESNVVIKRSNVDPIDSAIRIVDNNRNITVRDNRVDSATSGITVAGTTSLTIERNNLNVGGTGIFVTNTSNCQVRNNVAYNTGTATIGLHLSSTESCQVTDNVLSEFTASGMYLVDDSARNFIKHNTLNNNGEYGIHFDGSTSTSNVYGGNTGFGNVGAGTCSPSGSSCGTPGVCDEASNVSSGGNRLPGSC
ncbi:MAG: hypothetical protein GY716_14950 [bacterium]|nr:hypothetical protein [bacterium]